MISRAGRQLISFAPSGSGRADASFRIGLPDFSYLADHGFQDLTVVPGAFYVELALALQTEQMKRTVRRVIGAEFLSPLILAGEPVVIAVEIAESGPDRHRYEFRESAAGGERPPLLASLEVDSGPPSDLAWPRLGPPIVNASMTTAELYARLRSNGNQYGPRFQALAELASEPGRAAARLAAPGGAQELEGHHLHPVLLDAAIQLLGTAAWDRGQTYVLREMAEVQIGAGELADAARLEATWNGGQSGSALTGDVTVFDRTGTPLLRLQGVTLAYLAAAEIPELVVASTFTAEPIETVLRYWSDTADMPVKTRFAPYGQVFQELLNPGSQFRRNRDGLNVVLLNLGDWVAQGPRPDSPLEPAPAGEDWAGLATHDLPNGLQVAHLNRHETEYVYQEIFEDQCYLRHGVRLSDAQSVIDIGANIGLFSLFVRTHCPGAQVYCFEPSPVAFRALAANCSRYGPGLHPFNVGVAERRGSAPLTFYAKSSVFSSFHPDQHEDRQAIRAVVTNMVQKELRDAAEGVEDYVDALMTDRLASQTFECPLVAVSDIIRDQGLQRVDLLKIDAEKCELEILRGVDPAHWPLIRQVVIEVHDATGKDVAEVQAILEVHGFRCAVEEEKLLTGSGLFNVYATRPDAPGPSLAEELQNKAEQLASALIAFAGAAAAPTCLMVCPPSARPGAEAAAIALAEDQLLRRLEAVPGLSTVGSRTLLQRYPGTDWHNAATDRLGHIPYGDAGFAALGTSVFRALAAARRAPYKVIVLDCDRTLWDGEVGEDGPKGVQVTAARREVQEFMIRQQRAGMILALCSKNDEAGVWAVFAENAGMALKREHLAAARINWRPKSENLRSLAQELKAGLDSFIFVDDNPVECAEVRAHCPGPLVIELPPAGEAAAALLEQVWAFDHGWVTREDTQRTRMMQEGAERERYRNEVASLADFIAGLELKVEFFEPRAADLPRVAQLTQRTNQFNLTTVRRTESELRHWLEQPSHGGFAVAVRDRFGDYGLVGLVLYESRPDLICIDTFLLSCRVLGRGIEHRVLAEIGRRAQAEGKGWVQLAVTATEKNLPAREFVREVAGEGGQRITSLAASAAHMAVAPVPAAPDARPRPAELNLPNPGLRHRASFNFPNHAPGGLVPTGGSAAEIAAAVDAHRLRIAGFDAASASEPLPADLPGQLLHLWRKTLGNPRIGLDDNFLDVGGTSLKAVQLVASIRRQLQQSVSVLTFFECPTVRKLSERLEPASSAASAASNPVSDAMERGARRNQRLKRPPSPPS
jgi:FkbH-like protein/FkbM family methyltransferase